MREASAFYTGLVAELYDALASSRAPVSFYADLLRDDGTPALELACGSGHPLLALLAEGFDVEGLDSSPDMLARCRADAAARGLAPALHEQEMQRFSLPSRYRTIFLAGGSFMLIPDLGDVAAALGRIHAHLVPGGRAVIPLYLPHRTREAPRAGGGWATRESTRAGDGATLRVHERFDYDHAAQLRVATLRYEVLYGGGVTQQETRTWILRWHTQEQFRALLAAAGFAKIAAVRGDHSPATGADAAFVFLATR